MIQQHPDYHDGFFDALEGVPLFVIGRTAEYIAGWRAYWRVHDELDRDDFIGSSDEAHLPVFAERDRHH
jgi:hypothetical protein